MCKSLRINANFINWKVIIRCTDGVSVLGGRSEKRGVNSEIKHFDNLIKSSRHARSHTNYVLVLSFCISIYISVLNRYHHNSVASQYSYAFNTTIPELQMFFLFDFCFPFHPLNYHKYFIRSFNHSFLHVYSGYYVNCER